MDFKVLHGIVDCLWVEGSPVEALRERVERKTGLPLEAEHFDWIVFLPLADGFGAYNRYYGRLPDGSIRVRGVAARRHDTPEYVREMQRRMFAVMARAKNSAELKSTGKEVADIFRETVTSLPAADPRQMVINHRISRLTYSHRCIEGAAVQAYRDHGIGIAPGMKIQYIVTDARRYRVEPAWCAKSFDLSFYRGRIDRAYAEIVSAYSQRNQVKKFPVIHSV
jgi:DNA polymerase I